MLKCYQFSFLQAFDRRPWTVNEQIKIIQDFLDVSAHTDRPALFSPPPQKIKASY